MCALQRLGSSKLMAFSVPLKNVYMIARGFAANIHCKKAPCFKGVTETEFMLDVMKGRVLLGVEYGRGLQQESLRRGSSCRRNWPPRNRNLKAVETFHTSSQLMAEQMKAIVTKASDARFDPNSAVLISRARGRNGRSRPRSRSRTAVYPVGVFRASPNDVISCAEEVVRDQPQYVGSLSAFSRAS